MALNPDPRPGRWLLPLVVLGMVVFTYVFVRSLPGAEAGSQDVGGGETTTTTVAETETEGDGATATTSATVPVDEETQAYLDTIAELEAQLTGLQTEVATINGQWDAEPRQVEFGQAEAALEDVVGRARTWAEQVAGVVPPDQLAEGHQTLTQFAVAASDAVEAVLSGLRAPDTGEARRAAVEQFDQAVRGFTAAVDDVEQQALGGTGA